MTDTIRFPSHSTTSARAGRRPAHTSLESGRRPSARASARHVSEAVVASYIHELSRRDRGDARGHEGRSRRPAYLA